jgi:hypothetical protein
MGKPRLRTVNLDTLIARYREVPEGFHPNYWAQVRGGEIDYVQLGEPDQRGIRWGTVPNEDEPLYVEVPGGKWQHLERAGLVDVGSVRYLRDWVPYGERVGDVYFIQAGEGAIKIGWSQDVFRRIIELQTASAEKLKLLGVIPSVTMQEERNLHRRFASIRKEAEWFQPSSELLSYVRKNATSK